MSAYQKLTSFVFISVLLSSFCSAQVLFSTEDGWDGTGGDDTYATGDDLITINFGSDIDSRYVFDASSYVDTWCLAIDGTQRSHSYQLQGTTLPAVGLWQYGESEFGGITWTIQTIGGDGDTCRFNLWKDKSCDEWYASQLGTEYSAGCEPDMVSESLDEGLTDTYNVDGDDVEVSCLAAGVHNYVKCQAPTYTQLSDCIDSSLDEDGGGDSFRLYDACVASSTSSEDTDEMCDVVGVGETWELSALSQSMLSDMKQEIYLQGIPNASFQLFAYTGCGTGAFDRDKVAQFQLTQFTEKSRVCSGVDYEMLGGVVGYLPWFGEGDFINETYQYGGNTCSAGNLCVDHEAEASDFDPDLDACFLEPGASCYDGRTNQDEIEADYGGVCGNCSTNSSARDDTYWNVAFETERRGFFGVDEPFESQTYCPQAEDTTGFFMVFVVVISSVLLIFGIIVFLLIVIPLALFIIGSIKGLLSKKRKKE